MKLEIVSLLPREQMDELITIEQGNVKRQWMDETNQSYAYRCLPLNMANQHGWAIYPKNTIKFVWNGFNANNSIGFIENPYTLATSWFGNGIVTFGIPFMVRTEPGYNLYITGAPNHHMKGIQPLSGIFESDWAPYTFTMNWRIIQKNYTIEFTKSDPICFFFPIKQTLVEETELIYSDIKTQDKYYVDMLNKFQEDRENFNSLKPGGWQKTYFQGLYPDGQKCPYQHRTKIQTKPIK